MRVSGKILQCPTNQCIGVGQGQIDSELSLRPEKQGTEYTALEIFRQIEGLVIRFFHTNVPQSFAYQYLAGCRSGVAAINQNSSLGRRTFNLNVGSLVPKSFEEEQHKQDKENDQSIEHRQVQAWFDSQDRFKADLYILRVSF